MRSLPSPQAVRPVLPLPASPPSPGGCRSQCPPPPRAGPARAKGSACCGLGAALLPGTRGRCHPTIVAMVTAGGGEGFT